MKVIIPAAGLGRRFSAEGFQSPKELLPLDGKPLIWHALAEGQRAGFQAAVVVVSLAKQSLVQYLSENASPLPIEVIVQPRALGIGDAVVRCWEGEPIGVLLPDDVVFESNHWADLINLHRESGAATLCLRPVAPETTNRFGIAECRGDRVISLVEKPAPGTSSSNLAIFGRYVVTSPVVAGLSDLRTEGEVELTHGFAAAIATPEGVRAVVFTGRSYDCGTPAEYALSSASFTD